MDNSGDHPLNREILHWNDVIMLRYRQFLLSVTALDVQDANHHLSLFASLLHSYLDFIMRIDIPAFGENGGDSELRQLFAANHAILRRSLRLAQQSLEQIAAGQPGKTREILVDQLDCLIRLANILSRHRERNEDTLFPILAEAVAKPKAEQLAAELSKKMQTGPVSF